ncbi:PaaI family thioesterase [Gordonia shandongensis]|uniref:PaaI family thioesterase n=1 Tax=Gordonia shandongensis TaxID=376351 RepID=UPI000417CEF5|nr:PaaI family thioesterase [Gordonia shandongensis]
MTFSTSVEATDPFTLFAIGRGPDGADPEMTQRLGARLTDHRGVIEVPALTVLFDDIGGLPFFFADTGASSMQSRLSMSMLHRPAVDEVLSARADLRMMDPAYGTTSVTITGERGRTLCVGTARNVRVGRAVTDGDLEIPLPEAVDGGLVLPRPDSSLSGGEVVTGIMRGELPIGPIAEALGASIVRVDDSLSMTYATAPWMANIMGTMHGGVIAAMLAQSCSLAAQQQVRAGGDYQVIDFTCEFLRSPAVDGRSVRVEAAPVKLGRRLSIVDARMYDGDQLLGRATADARFDL